MNLRTNMEESGAYPLVFWAWTHFQLLSSSTGSHFSMLGIGDIVMPGLLLCFVLRYDNYKKQANSDSCGAPGPGNISGRMQKVSYFHCTLIGYFVGEYLG